MSAENQIHVLRWRDLYRIGGVSSILVAAFVLLAIAAFFIWPYTPTEHSMSDIFQIMQEDVIGGLISLDLIMLLTLLIYIFPILALYVSLKDVNDSLALIALVLGLLAIASVITSRPLAEMVLLSEKFSQAVTESDKNRYLAAGEAILVYFDGTAWTIQTVFLMVSGLISSALMLKSERFGRVVAWMGIVSSSAGLGFFIPVIGLGLLFLNTILTIPWCLLVGIVFIRLGWGGK